MKTVNLKEGKSRLFLLTVFLLLTGTMSIHAATYYGFKICNVKVTSDNYNKINSSNFSGVSGTITYDNSTKTLTLNNATLSPASGKHAIHLESTNGLTIKCTGTNTLISTSASTIRKEDNCGTLNINVESGNTTIKGGNQAIIFYGDLYIQGAGTLNANAYNNYPAIEGYSGAQLYFQEQIKATIYGKQSALYNMKLYFSDRYSTHNSTVPNDTYDVTLKATNNSSYPVVRNCTCDKSMICTSAKYKYDNDHVDVQTAILTPWESSFDSSKKSIVDNAGNKIYNTDILISTSYKALVTSNFFPDANFRSYIQSLYSNKKYLTQSDLNATTSIECNGKNISSLGGINFFSKLKTLKCANNSLSTLDLQYNTALTTLDCSSNSLTTFSIAYNKALTSLDCSGNSLTTLNTTSNTELTKLTCSSNNLATLSVKNHSKLTTLDCSNNTSMTSLDCSNCILTSLSVSGCSKLTSIDASSNKFTSLSVKNLANLATLNCSNNTSLTSLDCSSNALTSLNVSGSSNLTTINASSNKFYSLSVTNLTKLTTLNCSSNTLMTTLNCYKNALTTLNVSGCTKLATLDCDNNKLTSFSLTNSALSILNCASNQLTSFSINCANLTKLDCSNNQLTSLSFNSPKLTELDCSNNQLTSLYNVVSYSPNLTTLDCSDNQLTGLAMQGSAGSMKKLQWLSVANNTQLKSLSCHYNPLQYLNASECTALETLYCGYNNHNLLSLNIDGCYALKTLDCTSSNLNYLNLSSFNNLTSLYLGDNKFNYIDGLSSHENLKILDVSNNTQLQLVNCPKNQLQQLVVDGCTALQTLICNDNQLTSLDVSSCPNLTELRCGKNKLTTLDVKGTSNSMRKLQKLSIGNNPQLKTVYCQYNPLQEIYATGCTALETLNCGNNNRQLTTLGLTDCTALKELDITNSKLSGLNLSQFPNLEKLICTDGFNRNYSDPISNLSSCTKLKTLKCQSTKLTSLDLTTNTQLEVLDCSKNSIPALNLSNCPNIRELICYNNHISILNLSNCPNIRVVVCYQNLITTLTLPASPQYLERVHCQCNRIDRVTMGDIVSKLPNRSNYTSEGSLCVYYSYYDGLFEQNVCTTQHIHDAKLKFWTTYQTSDNTSFYLYEGYTVPTNIRTAEADGEDDVPRYNMSGQRVGKDYKGIVIVNGRKVVK